MWARLEMVVVLVTRKIEPKRPRERSRAIDKKVGILTKLVYQISDIRSQMSDLRYQISDVSWSDLRFQISDLRCQISVCQMSDFRSQISDFRSASRRAGKTKISPLLKRFRGIWGGICEGGKKWQLGDEKSKDEGKPDG